MNGANLPYYRFANVELLRAKAQRDRAALAGDDRAVAEQVAIDAAIDAATARASLKAMELALPSRPELAGQIPSQRQGARRATIAADSLLASTGVDASSEVQYVLEELLRSSEPEHIVAAETLRLMEVAGDPAAETQRPLVIDLECRVMALQDALAVVHESEPRSAV